jgi:tRNA(Ile2) C34 agmatinyltransferase TiaS
MSPANVGCPQCDGELTETPDPETYRCRRCETELRQVVVENIGAFERVADSGGPAAEIANVALGGDAE